MTALDHLEAAKEQKAQDASAAAALIKQHEAEYKSLLRKIKTGTELREIRCRWKYNSPKDGFKQLLHPDTGKVLETAQMSEFEKQESLFPEDSEKANEKKPDESKGEKGPVM